jgi:NAD(P)H-dependent FMN reductase
MIIVGVCGSLQRNSSNSKLLRYARECAPAGVRVELYERLDALPHFNPDLAEQGSPPAVAELREIVAHSDALLIACPEYGHSLPGSLKNAIDWLIGTGELEGKLVAITCAVPAAERGLRGLQALRDTLGAVSAKVAFHDTIVKGAGFEARVAEVLGALVAAHRLEGSS